MGLEWCGMGLQKETWDWNDLIPFRCLSIYRHLKKGKTKERNKCSLRVARFSAQNMAENLAPK